jgi:hypothetical protein
MVVGERGCSLHERIVLTKFSNAFGIIMVVLQQQNHISNQELSILTKFSRVQMIINGNTCTPLPLVVN